MLEIISRYRCKLREIYISRAICTQKEKDSKFTLPFSSFSLASHREPGVPESLRLTLLHWRWRRPSQDAQHRTQRLLPVAARAASSAAGRLAAYEKLILAALQRVAAVRTDENPRR